MVGGGRGRRRVGKYIKSGGPPRLGKGYLRGMSGKGLMYKFTPSENSQVLKFHTSLQIDTF